MSHTTINRDYLPVLERKANQKPQQELSVPQILNIAFWSTVSVGGLAFIVCALLGAGA